MALPSPVYSLPITDSRSTLPRSQNRRNLLFKFGVCKKRHHQIYKMPTKFGGNLVQAETDRSASDCKFVQSQVQILVFEISCLPS